MTMELDKHVLILSEEGRLHRPHNGLTPYETVERILDGFAASEYPSMTIYFHGGLVPEATALGLAQHFYRKISEDFNSYPVFVIWKSGPLETLQSAMLEINNSSPLFMQVLKKLTKWVARLLDRDAPTPSTARVAGPFSPDEVLRLIEAEELGEIDAEATTTLDALTDAGMRPLNEDDVTDLAQALADDEDADRALGVILMAAQRRPRTASGAEPAVESAPTPDSATGYLSAEIVERLVRQRATPEGRLARRMPESFTGFTSARDWFFAGKILRAVMERFNSGTDHGFFGTILEEMYRTLYADKVGEFLWNEMKENAAGAYEPIVPGAADNDIPGGTLFLEAIERFVNHYGPFALNVFGHSAGSIHIAQFVAAGAALMTDQFRLKNVFYTAPAINFDLFKAKMVPNSAHIDNFRIFTMSDRYERADPLVKPMPILYPHSLLYLVSGIFEDEPDCPLIGLDRHLQGVQDDEVQEFLDHYRSAAFEPVIYAVTPHETPVGKQAGFTSHYGAPGPNFDPGTLGSMAVQIRIV
jgi:hypothetical protein